MVRRSLALFSPAILTAIHPLPNRGSASSPASCRSDADPENVGDQLGQGPSFGATRRDGTIGDAAIGSRASFRSYMRPFAHAAEIRPRPFIPYTKRDRKSAMGKAAIFGVRGHASHRPGRIGIRVVQLGRLPIGNMRYRRAEWGGRRAAAPTLLISCCARAWGRRRLRRLPLRPPVPRPLRSAPDPRP